MKKIAFKLAPCFLCMLLFSRTLYATDHDISNPGTVTANDEVVIVVGMGTATGTTIETIGVNFDDPLTVSSGNVNWNFSSTSPGVCAGIVPGAAFRSRTCRGLTFTIPGNDGSSGTGVSPLETATIAVTGALTEGTFFVTLSINKPLGVAVSRKFTIKVIKPRDIMLVLDNSGSMGDPIIGGDTKWTSLKSGVDEFFANYQHLLLTTGGANGDQIGIRMFSETDTHPVNSPFNVDNFIPVTPLTPINTSDSDPAAILGGDSPDGSTAMGAGLEAGKNFLFPGGTDNGHNKAIVLFTDGDQNVPSPSGNVVATAGVAPSITGIDADLTNGGRIQIHTIGLGVAGATSQTLYYLAHESGTPSLRGISNIPSELANPDLNLNTYLYSISQRILFGTTPQYVDVRRSNFKLLGKFFGTEETFTVSKNIDKIIINIISRVSGESQARLDSIVKDGQPLSMYDTSYIKSKVGNGWQTFIISVSGIKKKIPNFTSDGKWALSVINNSQDASPYIISLTVDDHNSEMLGATTQTKELVVGDHLPFSIDFTKDGVPITGATAFAVVAKPGDDLGNLLAITKADVTINTGSDADNAATQKLKALLKDSDFVKKMLDSNHLVPLTYDAAQKKYVGEFNQLDVSGVYQVAYIVSATDTSLGEIKRYAEESVYIRFPDVNLDSSDISLITAPKSGGNSTFTFRPASINPFTGKLTYVGPGWDKAIRLDGKDSIIKIVDNGDGSYVLTIRGDLTENVTLSIGGDKIYTGKLENIGKSDSILKEWWFWLVLIIIILIIWLIARRRNNP